MGIFSSDEFGYSDWQEEHQKVMKYKKALKEIKEIVKENNELLQGYHKEWANNKLILNIIKEVEDEG